MKSRDRTVLFLLDSFILDAFENPVCLISLKNLGPQADPAVQLCIEPVFRHIKNIVLDTR